MYPNEQTDKTTSPIVMIAVHLGVSNTTCNQANRDIAKLVCETVMMESKGEAGSDDVLRRQTNREDGKHLISTAEEAVVRAIELMENEKSLNCGYGSNLNTQGKVECDASLMSSEGQIWAGVGSVSGCKSPIRLAKSLLDNYTSPRPLGLIQPNFLVASGARRWMREHCPHLIVPDSCLISSRALERYQDVKSRYDLATKDLNTTNLAVIDGTNCDPNSERCLLDTVGAVAVDCNNNYSCAVSSGGLILKHQGRVGQASVPGAGCWAQDSIAVTTTGVGEYLTATLFAKKFHEKLQTLKLFDCCGNRQVGSSSERHLQLMNEATCQCFRDFLDSPALNHVPASERLAGMLAISSFQTHLPILRRDIIESDQEHYDNDSSLYLSYGHNTKSLCIGYMSAGAREAKSIISSNENNDDVKKEHGGSIIPDAGLKYGTIKLTCRMYSLS